MISNKNLFFYLLTVLVIGGLIATAIVLGIKSSQKKSQSDEGHGTFVPRPEACPKCADINNTTAIRLTNQLSTIQSQLRGSCRDGWIQLSGNDSVVGTGPKVCYKLDGSGISPK